MKSFLSAWVRKHRWNLTAYAMILALYLFFFAVGITCPIKFLTGVSCAGCGMTRAWVHALTLRFPEAFGYHPVFWIVPIIAFFLWLQKRKPIPARIALFACLAVMLVAYVIRMIDLTDAVVVFAPREGAIYRTIYGLIEMIRS